MKNLFAFFLCVFSGFYFSADIKALEPPDSLNFLNWAPTPPLGWDNWPQVKEHFEMCNRWSPYIGNGHFPDADMLPLGRNGIRAERGDNRMCQLSKDEHITLMSFFSIFRSPLMFGGDLPGNDAFTLSLLNNEEVLYVYKYSRNNRQLFRKDDLIGWIADDPKNRRQISRSFQCQGSDCRSCSNSCSIIAPGNRKCMRHQGYREPK